MMRSARYSCNSSMRGRNTMTTSAVSWTHQVPRYLCLVSVVGSGVCIQHDIPAAFICYSAGTLHLFPEQGFCCLNIPSPRTRSQQCVVCLQKQSRYMASEALSATLLRM